MRTINKKGFFFFQFEADEGNTKKGTWLGAAESREMIKSRISVPVLCVSSVKGNARKP